jgi:hypothetical protein
VNSTYPTSLTPMITSLVGSSLRQLLNVLALNGVIEGEKVKERKRERRRRRGREEEEEEEEDKKKIDGG